MDTKEQIAVMQAYADGKKIQWRHPVGYTTWMDTDEPLWNWEMIEYRVKPEPILPKTWEEFCKKHHTKKDESFIDTYSDIREIGEGDGNVRQPDIDANLLPNKQIAESMLALCKLIQLRDCYNKGWQPDWSNDGVEKYTIYYFEGISSYSRNMNVLTFKTAELRNAFLNNFRDLIEVAASLL